MNRFILFLSLSLCLFPLYAHSSSIPVDGTAAVVNRNTITMSEVIMVMQPVQSILSRQYSGNELSSKLETAYKNTLASLVEHRLIIDEYRHQKDFIIPENIADMQIEEILHARFNNNRVQLMQSLEADGLTMQEWREKIMNRMIISFMRSRATEHNVIISPQSIREEYQKSIDQYRTPPQVELRMIIIHRGSNDQEIATRRQKAENVRDRILKGEDFAKLASAFSEGVKSKEGGYWGWLDPTSRRSELSDVLTKLEPGEVSEVVEAGNSFYIMKIEARQHPSTIPFDEVRHEIQSELAAEQSQRDYEQWIEYLKQKSYIRKY